MAAMACASSHQAGVPAAAEHVVVLQAAAAAPTPAPVPQAAAAATGGDVYDPPALFHAALEAAHADDASRAVALYTILIETFPTHRLVAAARYNRGLQYENLTRLADAVVDYRLIVAHAPHDPADHTGIDAQFRLGVCLTLLHQGWAAVSAFDAVLRDDRLDDDERLEAMLGRGIAMQDIGADAAAEAALGEALHFFETGQQRDRQSDRDLAAEAAFRLGQIATGRFSRVTLTFPQDVLKARLEEKCADLLAAQNAYLRAIHLGDAHTLAAAGWGIGSLYESLYDAILAVEPPPTLNAEETAIYRDEVRQRVAVLVKKAIMVYERALLAGRAAGTAGAWVTRLEQALNRLKTIFLHGATEGLTPRVQTGQ